jgi:formylmethanofuran dehydrogenase subunit E
VAGKDSARLARAGAHTLVVGADGAAVFHPGAAGLTALLGLLPPDLDVVLVETFRPERYPVLLAAGESLSDGETLLGWFDQRTAVRPDVLSDLADLVTGLHGARAVAAGPTPAHQPHRCAGAILGRRLARFGASLLELDIPRSGHRLHVVCENDGCAADAIMAATGCRPGNRTLRFLYYGKMAAMLIDTEMDRAIRVAAAGDCRAAALLRYPDMDRHLAQMLAYARASDDELFRYRWVSPPVLPGPRRRHLLCAGCEEEVDGDAAVAHQEESYCRPCAAARAGVAAEGGTA